jgi:lysophospholipase-3
MLLQYDEKTHTTFNNDGVETRVPGFGNTTTVEYLGHDRLIGKIVYTGNVLLWPQFLSKTPLLIGKSAQYYHAMAEALVFHLGYQRGINLHGAPYDFRKAASKLLLFRAA